MRLFILILLLILSASAWAAKSEKTIVYTQVNGQFKDFNSDFHVIAKNAVNSLQRFEVVNMGKDYTPSRLPLKERIKRARLDGIRWVADITLETGRDESKLTMEIYNSANSSSVFKHTAAYESRKVKALLAQVEYQLPLTLKNRFLEIGRIIRIEDKSVYIDLGSTADIRSGQLFLVYEQGMEIEDEDGNLFGYLEDVKGVIKVIEVNPVYAICEIITGRLNIDDEQYVRAIDSTDEQRYTGRIVSVLENQVAISIGKRVGVQEGSYFAVYRDVQGINSKTSFRTVVGYFKIKDVMETVSKGELTLARDFELSKYTIQKGDYVEEVESPRKNGWSIFQLLTNLEDGQGTKISGAAYQRDSSDNPNLIYRLRAGYGLEDQSYMAAFGAMQSIANSSHHFIGAEVVWIERLALNTFVNFDVDTPLSENLKLNVETGYFITKAASTFRGFNASIGMKYGFDLF